MKKLSWLMLSFLLFLVVGVSEAYAQDAIAVLKFDVEGDLPEENIANLSDAIRTEILNTERGVNTDASDTSFSEMQMLYDCDPEAPIACYEIACSNLGVGQLVFGTITEDNEAVVTWYVSGKGIFRELESKIDTKEDAVKLAKRLIIGDIGYITVTSNVPGADILLDEKRVGMTAEFVENAKKIELRAGKYVLSVVSEGYVTNTQTIHIDGFQDENIHIDLFEVVDYEALRKKFDISGYTLIGAGAAMLAAGGGLGGKMMSLQDELNKAAENGNPEGKDMSAINTQGGMLERAANAMFGLGGIVAAGGVALILVRHFYKFEGEELQEGALAPDAATASKIPDFNFAVTPEYQGMSLGWKF